MSSRENPRMALQARSRDCAPTGAQAWPRQRDPAEDFDLRVLAGDVQTACFTGRIRQVRIWRVTGRTRRIASRTCAACSNTTACYPTRDEYLARFETRLASKLDAISKRAVRGPVEQFATWHHLSRLRRNSLPGQSSDGPVRSAKQEITETIKFLTWLNDTHHRTAATCNQQDVNEYLASGPTTRHLIRTFFVWAKKSKINKSVQIGHRQAKTTRSLTQDQRLAWLKELLQGDAETLPYRVAGTLLLLYAQPLVRVAALETTAVVLTPRELRISLGKEPAPIPEPFAGMLRHHLNNRPNLRTAGGAVATRWLFPGYHAGKHLDPQSIMFRLRELGINLLGARNAALQKLVAEVPPPLVAELLGYSYQVAHRHAEIAAQPWSRYVT